MSYAKLAVYFLIYIARIEGIQGYTIIFQYVTADGGNLFKITQDIVIGHKILMKFMHVTRTLSRIVCLKKDVHRRNCACTRVRERIIIHYNRKPDLSSYDSDVKSNCRNLSEALHWSRKVFGDIINVYLCVARQQSQKLSDFG